ncbi:MAG: chromosomal replication initiator protein DnaA [Sphaerochaetaceae bacterium]|jgi:chromosomal replication initiator protein
MSQQKYNYSPFWDEVFARMAATISEQDVITWLNRVSYAGSKENTLILGVPSLFVRDYISTQYLDSIGQILNELTGEKMDVELIVKQSTDKTPSDSKVVKKVAAPIAKARSKPKDTNINPTYQFDSFVVGDNNSFAYNASIAIAKNPGVSYNPCLIYGGVGLGKTHLIQSIGNYIQDNTPELQVVYVTAEMFTNEFIQAIGSDKTPQFRNKYRKADVLLIDDIHFLQKKASTQEEMFHVFNNLFEANKQLVFTCDRPITELKDIADRLKNRFSRGINVDLQTYDFETRLAILNKKCEIQNCHLSEEVLDFIARTINTNVRDLEASLTKLIAYSHLLNKEITLEIAQEQLRGTYSLAKDQSLTIDTIIRVVADYFNISPYDIKGKKRTKSVVLPRQIAMYIGRSITDYSTTEIGYEFGGRDHTTVMHSVQKIEGLSQNDIAVNNSIQHLIQQIQNLQR